jgi:hypothetical protein
VYYRGDSAILTGYEPNATIDSVGGTKTEVVVPRLKGKGDYPSWRGKVIRYVAVEGAADTITEEVTREEWEHYRSLVDAWKSEEVKNIYSKFKKSMKVTPSTTTTTTTTGSSSPSSSSSTGTGTPSTTKYTDDEKKELTDTVKRSDKVYRVIHNSLPEEIQFQVSGILNGHVYALWMWLENKYQSMDSCWNSSGNVHSYYQ